MMLVDVSWVWCVVCGVSLWKSSSLIGGKGRWRSCVPTSRSSRGRRGNTCRRRTVVYSTLRTNDRRVFIRASRVLKSLPTVYQHFRDRQLINNNKKRVERESLRHAAGGTYSLYWNVLCLLYSISTNCIWYH